MSCTYGFSLTFSVDFTYVLFLLIFSQILVWHLTFGALINLTFSLYHAAIVDGSFKLGFFGHTPWKIVLKSLPLKRQTALKNGYLNRKRHLSKYRADY